MLGGPLPLFPTRLSAAMTKQVGWSERQAAITRSSHTHATVYARTHRRMHSLHITPCPARNCFKQPHKSNIGTT